MIITNTSKAYKINSWRCFSLTKQFEKINLNPFLTLIRINMCETAEYN